MKYLSLWISLCFFSVSLVSCSKKDQSGGNAHFIAIHASEDPMIDGLANEACWTSNENKWYPIDEVWQGSPPSKEDFSGRFKLAWTDKFLFILAEITDDTLVDSHFNGLSFYWDDDCMKVYVDENHSGGDFEYNHNAFAYYVALNGDVTGMGADSLPKYYTGNFLSARTCNGNTCTWELAVKIFDDSYNDFSANYPMILTPNKVMGFSLGYCDNDHSKERENLMGSNHLPQPLKGIDLTDASVFGTVELKE